jgi:hypothetical protein
MHGWRRRQTERLLLENPAGRVISLRHQALAAVLLGLQCEAIGSQKMIMHIIELLIVAVLIDLAAQPLTVEIEANAFALDCGGRLRSSESNLCQSQNRQIISEDSPILAFSAIPSNREARCCTSDR